jgi:hypothetical protein
MISVIQPSVNQLNGIQLSVSPLNVVLLSGIVSSVVLLNIVAPIRSLRLSKTLTIKPVFLVPFFSERLGGSDRVMRGAATDVPLFLIFSSDEISFFKFNLNDF